MILLDLIRVDARYRRRGIGRRLFALALEEARRLGAREMRISANHAEETVRFYRAMGAETPPDPPARMTETEPYDVPMRIFP